MMSIIAILFTGYVALVIWLIIGWRKAFSKALLTSNAQSEMISVIIPARNEASLISFLLNDLSKQRHNLFEVIIVDDNSEDNTTEIIVDFCKTDKRFIYLPSKGIGKKQALAQGIDSAQGSIIVTTDSDCRVGEDWLEGVNICFQDSQIMIAFGGVKILENETFFSKLQALEFCSLIGVGFATQAMGFPTMCNGANLAFRKQAFNEVGGYNDNLHVASGDDEFLLRKMVNRYPKGVSSINRPDVVVCTQPQRKLNDFIHQRIRWAGKWKYHKDVSSKILAIYIFTFQFSMLAMLPMLMVGWIKIQFVFLIWLTKFIIEFLFLQQIASFLKVKWRWISYFTLQIVYPFYAVYIGLVSHFQPVKWKDRVVK